MDNALELVNLQDWIEKIYPTSDSSQSVIELKESIDAFFNKKNTYLESRSEIYDMIDLLDQMCREKSETNDSVEHIILFCKIINSKLINLQKKIETNKLSLGNNYFLDTDSLPIAVQFLKYVRCKNMLYKRMTRKYLEERFVEFLMESNSSAKFSTVLFALSWMNILSVYNSNFIHLNIRNKKFFE
tara:strand:- start:411 stop:968 length:558 start_codon:yes stop_codon:yes gene_type:complete